MREIAAAQRLNALWQALVAFMEARGFEAIAYYLLHHDSHLPSTIPLQKGFDPELLATYAAHDFQRLDVVPRAVIAGGAPASWMEIWGTLRLTPAEQEFYEALRASDMQDGYSLPCYGPNGRQALISIGMMREGTDRSETTLSLLNYVAQAAHLRICNRFFRQTADDRQLSAREKEILDWVARGKSNSVIGDILNISAATVDTYMRRIYEKLDVSDRTSAAVKGVGLGLIAA
ncbi:MAG: LuxR family transcriptional regulator [Sphingobium sp.]|nr:LuxR family transcriptional regulator [Sphingobium sp.]